MKQGEVCIFYVNTDKCFKIMALENLATKDVAKVIDLRWDPCSTNYLLSAFSNGRLCLIDIETLSIAVEFEAQPDITGLTWNKNVPGSFVTVNARASFIDIWNVSQKFPLSRSKIAQKSCGIHTIQSTPSSQQFVLAFKDGSVGVFGIKTRRLHFSSQPGHSETIFDCRFDPHHSNTLATSSYDGTIKIWDTKTCSFSLEMTQQSGIVYACAWEPEGGSSRLVSSSSEGDICIWDTRTGFLLQRFQHHNQAVYRVVWSTAQPDFLASSSHDNFVIVFSLDGKIHHKIQHPASVFGCDFDAFNGNLLITGCYDGIVRVFDLDQSTQSPIHTLRGHSQRVFHTVWSPLLRGYAASGSDDTTIRVWNIGANKSDSLIRHTDRVRALIWNTEIPYILISGSWDTTICVWDIRTQTCLTVFDDHHADVYGLSVHAMKPFTLASSSRDTSLRIWQLDDNVFASIFMKCLVDPVSGIQLQRKKSGDSSLLNNVDEHPLWGEGSKKLQQSLDMCETNLQRFSALFNFFFAQRGLENFFNLAESECEKKNSASNDVILHMNDVRDVYRSKAKALESDKVMGFGAGKKNDRLNQAADMFLKTGNTREYCELMTRIGQWEKAIAIAPCVSLSFWRSLCQRYARKLAETSAQDAVAYWMASGEIHKAVKFYETTGDFSDAFLVSISSSSSNDFKHFHIDNLASNKHQNNSNTQDHLNPLTTSITEKRAERYLQNGDSVLAACCHLATGDIPRTLRKLIRGGEYLLAVALTQILHTSCDDALRYASLRAERMRLYSETCILLSMMSDSSNEIALMCARYEDEDDVNEFYSKMIQRFPSSFNKAANEHVSLDPVTAIREYVAGRSYTLATSIGLKQLRKLMGFSHWSLEEARTILHPLHSVAAAELEKPQRMALLAFSAYLGALQGRWLNFGMVVTAMFNVAIELITTNNIDFPIPIEVISLQLAKHLLITDKLNTLKLVKDIESMKNISPLIIREAKSMKRSIECGSCETCTSANAVILTASQLPSGRSNAALHSSVTGVNIVGAVFELDDNHETIMSQSEALMWTMLNPFSPLNNGHRINPF